MTQNPRILETKSSKTLQLKPPLAAALACLEVQLDQELARYRRTKTAYKAPSQIGTSSQPQPFTAITTTTARSPAAIPTSLVPQEKFIEQPKIPPVSVPETQAQMPVMKTANTETPPPPPPPEVVVKKETTQEANSSIVPAKQQKVENPPSDETPKQPDGYLESSEALLRSLTEEQPQKTEKTEKTNSDLLSPLGIGSILLLLVASLTLGYVIYNPKSLSVFSLGKESQPNLPATSSTTNVKNTTLNNPKPANTPIPKYPNLATDEFPEVNNPNDVVGLKPKAKPTPTAPKPVAALPVTQSAPSAPVQPQPLPPVTPPKPTVTTSPLPAIGQKAIADAKPSADGFYHVVIENVGSSAFESARVVIPDAYLSPDKKLIYLGALKTKAQLKEQMQLLESKGIKARVQ